MSGETQSFDAVVIGAGFSGMHMLKSLRDKLGLKVQLMKPAGPSAAPGAMEPLPRSSL